jgi:hypothetical protein
MKVTRKPCIRGLKSQNPELCRLVRGEQHEENEISDHAEITNSTQRLLTSLI